MRRFIPGFPVCLLTIAIPLAAETLLVPEDFTSIQQAILASSDGDTVLVSAGTYLENIHFLGKAITLHSADGPSSTVIDGSSPLIRGMASTVRFVLGEGPDTVLEGFTITGGAGCNLYGPYNSYTCGGGICCYLSAPTLRNCRIIGNSADYGGGCCFLLPAKGSSEEPALLEGCLFEGNHAVRNAGGLMMEGNHNLTVSTIVRNCIIAGNTGEDLNGGAYLYRIHAPEVRNCIVSDNTCGLVCGGMEMNACSLSVVDNCVFTANSSPQRCVGLCLRYCGAMTVANSTLWDNDSLGYDYELYLQNTTALLGYCDLEGGQAGVLSQGSGGCVWGEGNLDLDPQFEQGPLSDCQLAPTSPCIDAGDPAPDHGDPEDPSLPGMAQWPALGTVRCDMGAFGGNGAAWWEGATGIVGSGRSLQPCLAVNCLPNPAGGTVVIRIEDGFVTGDRILVLDLTGRIRIDLPAGPVATGAEGAQINLGDLSSGLYVVVLVREGTAAAATRVTVLD